MINITIDDKDVSIPEKTTIMEAATNIGIIIPSLCHMDLCDPKMVNRVASCRICSVEIEGSDVLHPSCSTIVTEGMKVLTNSHRVLTARRKIMELIVSDHPFECLICNKSTTCELQNLVKDFGISQRPFKGRRSKFEEDHSSKAIQRDPNKCILCRRCETMCHDVQTVGVLTGIGKGFEKIIGPSWLQPLTDSICTFCGQCVSVCPTGALYGVINIKEVWEALFNPMSHVIVQVAPAVRVGIGEMFGFPSGEDVTGKLISALRKLGFNAVFNTTFAADLTVIEEAVELISRIQKEENLPLLSSCCPAWINFAEYQFPELKHIPSTCKSPQQMMGSIMKSYYAEQKGLERDEVVVVSIMPCIAKKYEAARPEYRVDGVPDVDFVLTTQELSRMVNEAGLDLNHLPSDQFDEPFGKSSGAGDLFGTTGGVLEASLRTAFNKLTGKDAPVIDFQEVRGLSGVRETTVLIGDLALNVAATSSLGNARKLLNNIRNGTSKYHLIEVMACPGGCINGGGQPHSHNYKDVLKTRSEGLYNIDRRNELRNSHDNPAIKELYDKFLGHPGSSKAYKLLHNN